MLRLVLATANPDKAAEIVALMQPHQIVPRPLSVAEVTETGATLIENARLKARAIASATGEPAVADDTGLEVDALGGRPGVLSARFAGPRATYADNVAKLLAVLGGTASRSARFRTVALVALPRGGEISAEGVVEGRITATPRGEGGFGYDPVFEPLQPGGRTFAEMSATEKNTLSHRSRAFVALKERLAAVSDS